jgi:hypothetical protein
VSVGAGGAQGDCDSFGPQITPDAQVISFVWNAGNLLPGDGNLALDVFVRDLTRGSIERLNVATDGTETAFFQPSLAQSMSADGRFVAFQSYADNLTPGDGNGESNVFLRDRRKGTTERVVLPPALVEVSTGQVGAQLSATGRFIAATPLCSRSDATSWTARRARPACSTSRCAAGRTPTGSPSR